ncbi:hypothetical protein DXG01_000155 [Tephrocybe rancida]|nr:hypothetical protein DXG01_000155 [Tephrocybe rancida]
MFSQFRQAVENLAPAPRSSLDGQPPDAARRDSSLSRSNSLDSPLHPSSPMSSSQLAESALSNLRKSLATQRSGSTGSLSKTASPTPPREGRTKSRLEDRLRAATSAISEPPRPVGPVESSRKPTSSTISAVSSHPLLPEPAPLDSTFPEPVADIPVDKADTDTVKAPTDNMPIPQLEPNLGSPEVIAGDGNGLLKESLEALPTSSTSHNIESLEVDTPEDSSLSETTPIPPDLTERPTHATDEDEGYIQPTADDSSSKSSESDIFAKGETTSYAGEPAPVTDALEEPIPSVVEKVADNELASLEITGNPPLVPDETTLASGNGAYIEELQEKLRLVEQRFADVSISFKRLQEEKQAADLVLRELTPLETIHDSRALRDYFASLVSKTEVFQDEIKRLNGKLESQEDRLEELQDTHRLESSSQNLQMEKLRTQLSEAEALLNAAHSADAQAEEVAAGQRTEMDNMLKELERAKLSAKEEEEKRVKAISLLKTVRQKLVKAEKEKEEALNAATATQERDRSEREREQAERSRLRSELDASNTDREKALAGLKSQFDKELANFRDRYEKEIATSNAQSEADLASVKNTHAQEISTRDTQTRTLQQSLSLVTADKNAFFDDLQLRQAELESAQSHLESLESQNTELQYQLRELGDRYTLLKEDFAEAQRDQEARSREPTTSSDEVARLLSATESKYESKLFDLKKNLLVIEKERNESEADWSRKLRDKTREVEDLKRLAGLVAQTEEQHVEVVAGFKASVANLEGECRVLQEQLQELRQINASVRESEKSWKSQEQDLNSKVAALEHLVEESGQRESQLRAGNKTLREELRKVQSSAALLERQRNPGVGYWTSRPAESNPTASQVSVNSPSSGTASRVSSPDPNSGQKTRNDEEVNLEYLRNVILQFLEHKEMRKLFPEWNIVVQGQQPRLYQYPGIEFGGQWLDLCKLLISKQPAPQSQGIIEVDLSNSVLALCRSYPGDPDLRNYLKQAIRDGSLSIATFVVTLLQAARSSQLQAPTTLDMLCRVALDQHYSSRVPPIGSVVAYDDSPLTVLGIVQDALALLRMAHSLPLSHFHQLTTSASELLILLLSCVPDISQVSTAQVLVHLADASDLLQNFQLTPDVRPVLEDFVISLSMMIGDDAKAAREAQMLHTIQMALGKGTIHGSGSETDIVTFSLCLHHLVSYKARDFGAGDSQGSTALFVALYRWAAWPPSVFYTQLFLSAFTCLAQSASKALIWKAFLVGRLSWPIQLPRLLVMFETAVNVDGVTSMDWKRALQAALQTNFRQTDLVGQCDHAISMARRAGAMQEDELLRSFTRDLLQSMIQLDLIPMTFAIGVDPFISNDDLPRLQGEAQDCGLELGAYLELKFSPDTEIEDLRPWVDRVLHDNTSHSVFAMIILRRFTTLAASFDVDALSHLCKVLYTYETVLDIMALHMKISDLIFRALSFLDQYDCETVGDPQTAVSHLGDVVIFVQHATARFHLESDTYTSENRTLSSKYLKSTDAIYPIDSLSPEDDQAFTTWSKALFDSSSEGIEDNILRTTQPKVLLKISATLLLQAIMLHLKQKIDRDTLNNGVSYFMGPLLSWTLVGIIKALTREIILQKAFNVTTGIEVLQTLLLSSSCPRPVLQLCAPRISVLLGHRKGKTTMSALPGVDVTSMRRVIGEAVGVQTEDLATKQPSVNTRVTWNEEPRQIIQTALNSARAGKAPSIDIEHCLKVMAPTAFLQLLWSEIVICASVGEVEISRRIATFVLTMPRSSNTPPLLPIFLNVITPSLIFAMDHQQPPEQTMKIELLVTIIASALTAASHLELGITSVTGEHRFVLGQSSSGMVRKLAADLRGRQDPTSRAILQRLAASQSLATSFSMSELG